MVYYLLTMDQFQNKVEVPPEGGITVRECMGSFVTVPAALGRMRFMGQWFNSMVVMGEDGLLVGRLIQDWPLEYDPCAPELVKMVAKMKGNQLTGWREERIEPDAKMQ